LKGQTERMTRAVLAQNFLDWIAQESGVATVLWSRSLAGGTHALTDVVTLPSGEELVLRRFPIGDNAVHRETRVLKALQGLDGLAPVFLASDPDGLTGAPTILTTLVPGSAWITPDDPLDFASQLGETLARIHGHPTSSDLPGVLGAATLDSALMDRWARILEAPQVLTHNDFWSGNRRPTPASPILIYGISLRHQMRSRTSRAGRRTTKTSGALISDQRPSARD
jgi:aminoglycoside phosphotransferase (APT) family kinase protein